MLWRFKKEREKKDEGVGVEVEKLDVCLITASLLCMSNITEACRTQVYREHSENQSWTFSQEP